MHDFKDLVTPEIRPQDDFYKYVNNKWLEATEIPDDKASISSGILLVDKVLIDLKSIFEKAIPKGYEVLSILHNTFLDTTTRDKLGTTPLKPIYQAIDMIANTSDLLLALAIINKSLNFSPLGITTEIDRKNSSIVAITILSGGYGLPDKTFYLDKDKKSIKQDYATYITDLFDIVGIEGEANDIITFEQKLSEVFLDSSQIRNNPELLYNKYTVPELSKLTKIDFSTFLKVFYKQEIPYVIALMPDALKRLGEVIATTDLTFWKVYLKFHYARLLSPYLSTNLVDLHFNFYGKVLTGQQKKQDQWKDAIATVNLFLGHLLGKLFVKEFFPPSSKVKMEEIVAHVIESTKERLNQLPWMEEQTRKIALAKCDNLKVRIGYPEKWKDFSRVKLTEKENLVDMVTYLNKYNLELSLSKYGEKPDPEEWNDFEELRFRLYPQMVNAWFMQSVINIVFPAAILQFPFFDPNVPDVVNYGSIGTIIAHEITHGFDAKGRKFDYQGNLKNWWTDTDSAQFDKYAQYFIDEYSNFDYFGQKINGKLTISENLADHGGILIAYHAMKKHASKAKGSLTNEELFFLSYARMWRGKSREKLAKLYLAINSHSPGYWRVNGTLANIKEFHETFNVKKGDEMYRENPPRFW